MSTVSVVIATRDRREHLAACLEHLARCAVPAGWEAEIVVVDNGSRDETPAVVRRFVDGVSPARFLYVSEPRPGKTRAVNRGVAASRGELLAFTDDDVEVDEQWLVAIVRVFGAYPGLGLLAGRVEMADPGGPRVALTRRDVETPLDPRRSLEGMVLGCNLAATRQAVERVGGRDARLGPGRGLSCEDVDFVYRVLRAGFSGRFSPEPVVYHGPAARDRSREYLRGWGAFYMKFLLRGDGVVLRQAFWESSRLARRFLGQDRSGVTSPGREAWYLLTGALVMLRREVASAFRAD